MPFTHPISKPKIQLSNEPIAVPSVQPTLTSTSDQPSRGPSKQPSIVNHLDNPQYSRRLFLLSFQVVYLYMGCLYIYIYVHIYIVCMCCVNIYHLIFKSKKIIILITDWI